MVFQQNTQKSESHPSSGDTRRKERVHIKIVRSDRGGEYYGKYTENGQAPGAFVKFLQENEIVSQYIMLGSPNQNCVTERRNRTLMDMVRSMRSNTKLPQYLWS